MSELRKELTKEIVKLLSMFAGYNDSVKSTEELLNAFTNAAFFDYIEKLGTGDVILSYTQPNFTKNKITVENNLQIGLKLGHSFYERIWKTDPKTGEVYLTPIEYLVVDLPFGRQQQHLEKKASIPDSNKSIDELTGQVAGASRKSALSLPEMQVMYSQGLSESIRELYKFRGGDVEGYRKLSDHALQHGEASMDAVDDGTTRTKSGITLNVFLHGMHLKNNF